MYRMNSCEEMLQYFYDVILNLLDTYLLLYNNFCYDNDQPWVIESLCCLIRRRQYDWRNGNLTEYRRLRNKVQRTAKSLKQAYCERCVRGLRKSNPRNWWQNVKRLTGQCVEHSIVNTGSSTCNDDLLSLSNKINNFLYLQPLRTHKSMFENECIGPDIDFIIEPNAVERKLINIDVHEANGLDNVPNWVFRDFSVRVD